VYMFGVGEEDGLPWQLMMMLGDSDSVGVIECEMEQLDLSDDDVVCLSVCPGVVVCLCVQG